MRTQTAASRPSTKALDNAAFGLHPQGYGLANRLADYALVRPFLDPWAADLPNLTRKRFYCGGIVARPGDSQPPPPHTWSQVRATSPPSLSPPPPPAAPRSCARS